MSFRLSGWQRVGIIASVLWALGAGLVTRIHDARHAQQEYEFVYNTCIDQKRAQQADSTKPLSKETVSECQKEGGELYQLVLASSWENVAIVALVPIPLGWLLVYAVVWIWRWVRRGFNIPSPPQ
jgi:hypothetical protein